jgi:hypothetical protein
VYSDAVYEQIVREMTSQLNDKMNEIGDIPEH